MTTLHADRLVADYLKRLDAAAAMLPSTRRAELVVEIREHIDAALDEAGAADEVTVRNVLERLGPPDEIVAATEGTPVHAGLSGQGRRSGGLEIAALLTLGVGGVLPVIGWLVGVILVMVSGAWSNRDKVIGLLLGLLPVVMLLGILLVSAGETPNKSPISSEDGMPVPTASSGLPVADVEPSDGGLGPLEVFVLTFGFAAGVPSALYLAWRLRRTPQDRALGHVEPAPGQPIVAPVHQ